MLNLLASSNSQEEQKGCLNFTSPFQILQEYILLEEYASRTLAARDSGNTIFNFPASSVQEGTTECNLMGAERAKQL